ncbi:hypothetical protein HHK36_019913 [Tetracentron sinense]|uniref:Uncharacterized protein n=1 Tax=Tetracentron sinense TaxID=13715 RepID=A0A834YU24_TETSI|nr:hypothetical protein HHK36_019913 [Tetracentron sinense]
MKGGRRRILPPTTTARKDRDEDLLLFREMHKRDKERIISLLQPVSDEFEPNAGNYPLYRIASAKKGPGYEFLAESNKNDYDWLKTPPATPLFPSLEMEANAPELAVHREIPIMQPLSRFSGNSEASKATRSASSNPKPKVPSRSTTPSARPRLSSIVETTKTKELPALNQKMTHRPRLSSIVETTKTKELPALNQKMTQLRSDINKRSCNSTMTITSKPMNQKETCSNFLSSKNSNTKPAGSRGVSPIVRSQTNIPGLSDETPPNLRTDRSTSASRGRACSNPTATVESKRQSCSPSMTRRGRKMEVKQESEREVTTRKGIRSSSDGSVVVGSRMVEKVMNARKAGGAEEKETKPKSLNESLGFGRMISRNSLDMALKHMAIKRDPISYRHSGTAIGKSSTTTSNTSSSQSTPRATQLHEVGSLQSSGKY